ncbi:DUF3617 domain-containing protein [Sphingomonas sp. GCM10030256]|uniref:DUF3617 domain-containing protein n=1 Tax=Sphingomonas sp. GCM10030256 TaxID=3273427 RepID=UPI003607BE5A
MTGRVAKSSVAASAAIVLIAAGAPLALRGVEGGRWEISRSASGAGASRLCVADVTALAQYEHRGQACTRMVLSDKGDETVIHYTCPAGDFGRTSITVITPRSLRLKTHGIHGRGPFDYTLYARRVGNCPSH